MGWFGPTEAEKAAAKRRAAIERASAERAAAEKAAAEKGSDRHLWQAAFDNDVAELKRLIGLGWSVNWRNPEVRRRMRLAWAPASFRLCMLRPQPCEHKSTIKFVTQRPDRRRQMTTIYRCKFDAFSFGYRYN